MISLTSTGGSKLQETVRRMMRKIATNGVWSSYSLRGRKGKVSLGEMTLCHTIISKNIYRSTNLEIMVSCLFVVMQYRAQDSSSWEV